MPPRAPCVPSYVPPRPTSPSSVIGQATSLDYELRAPGIRPVSLARLVGVRAQEYVNGLDDAYRALRRLLESDDDLKVGAAASKLADLCTRVLALAGAHCERSAELRSQADLPAWDHLSEADQARVLEALATLDALLGEEWAR